MKLISGDAGKFATKAVTKDENGLKKFNIRTKVEEIHGNETVSSKSHIVEYLGKKYILGDEACVSDYDTSKKKISHKLSLYTAVANLLDSRYEDVRLITGCPLTVFINPEAREDYRKYLADEKIVEISVDGEKKRFGIGDVVVLPESIGCPYMDTARYINSLVGVVDIGGLNTNGAIYERLKPVKASIFTANEGGNIIGNKIKKALNTALGMNYQDYEIQFLIEDSGTDKRVKEIIDNLIRIQVETIIEEMKKNNWNIGGIPIVFTGGGSLLLQREILAKIPRAEISSNAIWDNVQGFYRIGEVRYGR